MRLGPAIHGALLALALVFAYKTWTREPEPEVKGGDVVVWSESADAFESLVFEGKNKKVTIERRADNAGTYLWGMAEKSQTKVEKPKGPHDIPGHGGQPMTPTPTAPTDGAAPDGAAPGGATPGKAPDPKAPAKPDAKDPAKPAPKKAPAAKPTPKEPPEKAPKEPVKAPTDGAKADQNDPIPQDPAAKPAPTPLKPAPAPTDPPAKPPATSPAKPKTDPAKPSPTKPSPTAPAKPDAKPGATPTERTDAHDAADARDAAEEAHAAGAGTAATPLPAPGEKEVTVRQFPVGKNGTELIESLANLRALRSLGVPNDEQKIDYGLDETEETLTIKFKGGVQHTLLVGDRAYGGSDRYVLEPKSGKGYVLSSDLMKNFDSSENSLGLQTYNDFDLKDDLHQITVDVDGATQTLVRLEVEEEAKPDDKRPPKTRTTWARKEEPTSEDVTMANFVDRASKLRPVEYLPELDPKSLTLIARFEYGDKTGKSIGYLDFYKGVDPSSAKPGATEEIDYFMKTERTRVVGKVSKLTAERVDQDLAEVFGTSNGGDDPDAGAPAPDEDVPAPE